MDQWTGVFHLNSSWIEAVNLIVVRKKPKAKKNDKPNSPGSSSTYYDYQVATLEREGIPFVCAEEGLLERQKTATNRRRQLPSAALHESDFAVEWRSIVGHSVVAQFEAKFEKSSSPSVPQLFTEENLAWLSARSKCSPALQLLPPQLALRIAALRCLLVELGVLLVTRDAISAGDEPLSKIVDRWRAEVAKDPSAFVRLFQQERPALRPRLAEADSLLFEWWNWLTPTTVGRSPRYDTLFYLVVLPDDDSSSTASSVTTSISADQTLCWNSPDDLFSQYAGQRFLLSPTQLYELLRISSHPWADWLAAFARRREALGIRRWIPLVALYSNGTISYLPGDQYYPPKVDLLPSKTPRMYSSLSTQAMRTKTLNHSTDAAMVQNVRRMNRIEHSGYWCRVVVTIDDDAQVAKNAAVSGFADAAGGHLSIFYHELPVNRISANGDGANGAAAAAVEMLNAKL